MNFYKFKYIIWDWNGTLLDDMSYCVSCMNILLENRNMPVVSMERYRSIFTFPVQDYYKELGFDFQKESFDKVGHAFMDLYFKDLQRCDLFLDVKSTLLKFKTLGVQQFVLSAMEQTALERAIEDKGISEYFKAIYGIDNHLAAGKMDRAKLMIKKNNIDISQAVIIGDTVHDKEVADKLGCDIVLVGAGHQSINRLNGTGNMVIGSLGDLFTNL